MRTLPLVCFALGFAVPVLASPPHELARTQVSSLNDLLRELPTFSGSWEKQIRRLSACQEQLYLHERRMRGEGLPFELAGAFSANYSAILSALVDDRLSETEGRELLSIHRQILARTHLWTTKRVRNENFPAEVVENLEYFLSELHQRANSPEAAPDSIRTPAINGYQAWIGELIAFGEETGEIAPGRLSRIRVKLDELERFEGYYKADGVLHPYERRLLHERFLAFTRDTVETLAR